MKTVLRATAATLAVGLVATLGAVSCGSAGASPEQKCTDRMLGIYDEILATDSLGEAIAVGLRYTDADVDEKDPVSKRWAKVSECKDLPESSLKRIEKKVTNSSKGKAVEKHIEDLAAKSIGDAFEDAFSE